MCSRSFLKYFKIAHNVFKNHFIRLPLYGFNLVRSFSGHTNNGDCLHNSKFKILYIYRKETVKLSELKRLKLPYAETHIVGLGEVSGNCIVLESFEHGIIKGVKVRMYEMQVPANSMPFGENKENLKSARENTDTFFNWLENINYKDKATSRVRSYNSKTKEFTDNQAWVKMQLEFDRKRKSLHILPINFEGTRPLYDHEYKDRRIRQQALFNFLKLKSDPSRFKNE